MNYCNQCTARWHSITEKDVYGQDIEDAKRRFNEAIKDKSRVNPIIMPAGVWTVYPKPGYTFNKTFTGIVSKKLHHYMKTTMKFIRGTLVIILAPAVIILTAKIVVTYAQWLWNLW